MPKLVTKTNGLSREDWLEYRRKGIGGSDAAVVCGLNKCSSKIELWADKTGRLPEKEDNWAMRIGRDLEDCVANWFCEETGKKVRRHNAMYAHDDYDYILANVDRDIVSENAGLECKTTMNYAKWDFEGGEIPPYYYCQCCHYMNVMGYDRMYLAVLVFGKGFYWYAVDRNDADCKALLDAEIAFWNDHIVPDVRPEPDGSESAARTLDAVYHDQHDNAITMFEQTDAAAELLAVQAKRKALEIREEQLKQCLQNALDGNTQGYTVDHIITWRPQSRTAIDSKKLKSAHPDIYAECVKTTTYKKFSVTERKE